MAAAAVADAEAATTAASAPRSVSEDARRLGCADASTRSDEVAAVSSAAALDSDATVSERCAEWEWGEDGSALSGCTSPGAIAARDGGVAILKNARLM